MESFGWSHWFCTAPLCKNVRDVLPEKDQNQVRSKVYASYLHIIIILCYIIFVIRIRIIHKTIYFLRVKAHGEREDWLVIYSHKFFMLILSPLGPSPLCYNSSEFSNFNCIYVNFFLKMMRIFCHSYHFKWLFCTKCYEINYFCVYFMLFYLFLWFFLNPITNSV